MFDFHTADAIASSLLIMAMCSIGAHLVLEYIMNPALDTQLSEFPDDQQDHAPIHAKIKARVLCAVRFKLVDHQDVGPTSFDNFDDVIAKLNNEFIDSIRSEKIQILPIV